MADELQLIDIGANLMDDMFKGVYRGKARHAGDVERVLERAAAFSVRKIIITATTVDEARAALDFIDEYERAEQRPDVELFTTIGVHPTNCGCFDDAAVDSDGEHPIISALLQLATTHAQRGKLVAVGEFGLDYDRLSFCAKDVQRRYFELQFRLAERTRLPLFLHYRDAAPDFQEIVARNRARFAGGVVHSFTGSRQELDSLLQLDLYIGVNGCSLKSQDNLDVVRAIPVDRLLIETDAPWCEIRPSHAGYAHVRTHWKTQKLPEKYDPAYLVKSRNEPCRLVQVLEVLAALHAPMTVRELAARLLDNTNRLFPFGQSAALLGAESS